MSSKLYYLDNGNITIIPFGVSVEDHEEQMKFLNMLKPYKNASARRQHQILKSFTEAFNKFPQESREYIIKGVLRSVYENMKSRLVDGAPEKDKSKYYTEWEDFLEIPHVTTKKSDSERQLSRCVNTFKVRIETFIQQQINHALKSYRNDGILEAKFIIKYAAVEGLTVTRMISLDAIQFDFANFTVYDSDGRCVTNGIIVDAGDNFTEARLAGDFFLQDRAKQHSATEEVKQDVRKTFEMRDMSDDAEQNSFIVKLYNYTQSMERDQKLTLKGIDRVKNIMKQVDMMMNGGSIFRTEGVRLSGKALYLREEYRCDLFPVEEGVVGSLKSSLFFQLEKLFADGYPRLEHDVEMALCEDEISSESQPQTMSLKDLLNNKHILAKFAQQNLQTIINSINTVDLNHFVSFTIPGVFSLPIFVFKDKTSGELFFQLEQMFMNRFCFKHDNLQAFRKAVSDGCTPQKEHVRRIYIQHYPHPDDDSTLTFEIRKLIDATQMARILMPNQSKILGKILSDAIHKAQNNETKAQSFTLNSDALFTPTSRITLLPMENAKMLYISAKQDFDKWCSDFAPKGIPTIEEQLKILKRFTGVPVFYFFIIDGVKVNELQRLKLQQHIFSYNGKIFVYIKCGFSTDVAQRMTQHLENYNIPPQYLRLFFCHDIRIEQMFHRRALDDCASIKDENLDLILGEIGYVNVENKVANTEMYSFGESVLRRLETFEKFIQWCTLDEVKNKIKDLVARVNGTNDMIQDALVVHDAQEDQIIQDMQKILEQLKVARSPAAKSILVEALVVLNQK